MIGAQISVQSDTSVFAPFRLPLIALLTLIGVAAICVLPGLIANRDVDRKNPPVELQRSALRVIESIHPTLNGTEEEQTLYSILEPGVLVYHLVGPQSDHPARLYEYRAGLYMSRWHAEVFPIRRTIVDEMIFELWIVSYGGAGNWYRALREHSYCYVTIASELWSAREILHRFEAGPEPRHEFAEESVELPDGRVIAFPRGSNEGGAAEATPGL